MSDFKIGQRVWDIRYGWGEVVEDQDGIFDNNLYIVCVKFEKRGQTEGYTKDGRHYEDENRSLFFKEIVIPEDAVIPPTEEIILQKGDVILTVFGDILYVDGYSGSGDKGFQYRRTVPRTLDDAYSIYFGLKENIEKVIGNVER